MRPDAAPPVALLARWIRDAGIDRLELIGPDGSVRLVHGCAGAAAPTVPADTAADAVVRVRAGSVGVFLAAHPLATEPLVRAGDPVAAGQTVGLLRIGLVLLDVRAPRAGTVHRLVAAHASTVGFGDVLLEIR